MKREITVILGSLIALYSIEPVIREILGRGITVHVACWKKHAAFIQRLFHNMNGQIIFLDDLESQFSHISKIYRLVEILFTSHNFSYQYRLLRHPSRRDSTKVYWFVYLLSKYWPSWRHDTVNRRLKQLFSRIIRNPFPSTRIIVVSRVSVPYMLLAPDQYVITFMESWDHPVKLPMGYPSHKVFVWNKELGEDWTQYQGDTGIFIGYPMKLRYAIHQAQKPLPKLTSESKRRALYAVGSSSLTYIKNLYLDELRVIREVCLATKQAGWDLLIKPKPNGRYGDFDSFAEEFDHVEIGEYGDVQSTADYYLDDDYNSRRFKELRRCDLVINTFTTFALDAAISGVPVLQLDLRGNPNFPQIAESCTNHHLQRYLLGDSELTYAPPVGQSLHEGLSVSLTGIDDRPQRFSEKLRRWLEPSLPFEESVKAIVDTILED